MKTQSETTTASAALLKKVRLHCWGCVIYQPTELPDFRNRDLVIFWYLGPCHILGFGPLSFSHELSLSRLYYILILLSQRSLLHFFTSPFCVSCSRLSGLDWRWPHVAENCKSKFRLKRFLWDFECCRKFDYEWKGRGRKRRFLPTFQFPRVLVLP